MTKYNFIRHKKDLRGITLLSEISISKNVVLIANDVVKQMDYPSHLVVELDKTNNAFKLIPSTDKKNSYKVRYEPREKKSPTFNFPSKKIGMPKGRYKQVDKWIFVKKQEKDT